MRSDIAIPAWSTRGHATWRRLFSPEATMAPPHGACQWPAGIAGMDAASVIIPTVMDLTLAAIVIMSGWVVAMVAAGLAMALRPGGVAVRFAPAGAPVTGVTGRRDEILLGGEAEGLGHVRGTGPAGQLP